MYEKRLVSKHIIMKFQNTMDNKKNLITSWEENQVTYKISENRSNTAAQEKVEGKVYLTQANNQF